MKEEGATTGSTFAIVLLLCLFGAVGAVVTETLVRFSVPAWCAGAASSVVVIILLWIASDSLDGSYRQRGG